MEASFPLSEGKEAYSIVQWWVRLNTLSKHCRSCVLINRAYHFSLSISQPLEPGKGLYVCNFTHSLIHVYTILRLRNHHHSCFFHCYYHYISPSCRCTIPQFLLAQTTIYRISLTSCTVGTVFTSSKAAGA
jgi:hypothetical protein